jgi:predicted RNase H-like HicB family nuclease
VLDTVELSFRLICTVKKDASRRWVAGCPQLDIFSQGETKEAAKTALDEAVKLWIESCVERDTLDMALRECGFHRVTAEEAQRYEQVIAVGPLAVETDPEADTFSLMLIIPAYQAAAVLSSE